MTPFVSAARHLLLVDDDHGLRDGLAQDLGTAGYQVRTAENRREALETLAHHPVDGVVLNMSMAGTEGIATILGLRAAAPAIRIIALSGGQPAGSVDFLPLAKSLGASEVLRMPVGPEQLALTIQRVLEPQLHQRVG